MFDKLIESNSAEAEFKPRRKFFMVSFVVVGIVFLSALVFDLYADDLDLGTDNFELAVLLAPVATDVPEPQTPRQQNQQNSEQDKSEVPSRQALIAQINQTPRDTPIISTTRFTGMTIPEGRFNLNPNAAESNGTGPVGGPVGNSGGGSSSSSDLPATEVVNAIQPPPVAKIVTQPPAIKSEGVINGKATYLPVPQYPAPARMVGAYGVVNVQVMISEEGKVISAKAVSGHPLLRPTAESAAWKAKFSPTYLSHVPVKVTGVIVFNFKMS